MGKINVLSFAVANLIAAGEVVDRPASVVKELMENAIDAGADRVTVEIRNGGVTFLRVTDNGCGMAPDELPVAIRRHATSKIRDAEDLDGILTLGFRGEALAAIAAVSDLRIISKTPEAQFGAVLEAHGGEQITVTEQGCSNGTSVIVENLFANVPARRKFLKKDVTETMAVTANVEKVALSNPQVAVRLLVDGNLRLETAGDGDLMSTVYALFGKEFATRLIEVNGENEGIEVRGLIGRSDNFKSNRNHQNFFVNGRYVKSKTAMAALEQAYTSYMPPEKFPCCVLYIDVNPARVDVNVHPAKLEVKFSNEKAIFEAVYYTVRTALENNVTRPAMRLETGVKRGMPAGARLSDAMAPVENGRQESLQKRQLSYDLTGATQRQPQDRMSAEEYRRMVSGETEKGGARAPASKPSAPKPSAVSASDSIPAKNSMPAPSMPSQPSAETCPSGAPISSEPPISSVPPMPSGTPEPRAAGANDVSATNEQPAQSAIPASNEAAEAHENPARSDASAKNEAFDSSASADEIPASKIEENSIPVSYRIVGDVFHSYVIVELADKLLVIDQHAAHERILFEQLKAGLSEMETVSQMLMLPVECMLTSGEVEALRDFDGELQKIGFSLRYARNTVLADAIPEGVEPNAVADMLGTMAGRILDNTGSVKLTRDIIFEKALYQAACKAAIKAGRIYAEGHIEWLVKKLMEIPDVTFCPHGRPVAMELSKHTLDRQFDRLGF